VWWVFAAAFFLFGLFDVWKPLAPAKLRRLPGGFGVVADDVIAGITSCAVLQLGLWGLRSAGIVH